MKIRPCQVSLPCLPGSVSSAENLLRQEHLGREGEALGAESRVSWISPGPLSPDTPADDSIDELIKSSSDSGKLLAEFPVIFIPVFEDEGHNERGEIRKNPAVDLGFEPFYIWTYVSKKLNFKSKTSNHSNQMNDVPEMIEEIANDMPPPSQG